MAGVRRVPFDCDQIIGYKIDVRIVARLLVLLPLLWVEGVWAVDCQRNSYNIYGQAGVDQLAAEACDTIKGILQIKDGNSNIRNLDGLENLKTIEGSIYIEGNDRLTNINGLTNLTTVGGFLSIGENDVLTNIDGLARLERVGWSLSIYRNNSLVDVDGLANLTYVGLDLGIGTNPALTNIDGLGSVADVGGILDISDNDVLTNCRGAAPVLGWPTGPPDDHVHSNVINWGRNGERPSDGCWSVAAVLTRVSGPTRPIVTGETVSSNNISLDFTSSRAMDTFFPVTAHRASCVGSKASVSESGFFPFDDNNPHIERTLRISGYDDPKAALSSIQIDIDLSHSSPQRLYITLTTPEDTELVLWDRGDITNTLVGTFPSTFLAPVDSLDTVAGQNMNGDWVLSVQQIPCTNCGYHSGDLSSWGIRITEELALNGPGSPLEVSGATRGRDYTCTVAPVSKLGTTPVSDPYTVSVPLELPSVPTITSTDYEDGAIIVTVSVSDNGGTDITGYEATCTDGTNTFTGTSISSPITVSGLTNDVAYTCTVTATNSVGTSTASAATDPITLEASSGLPIWLLYQAAQ